MASRYQAAGETILRAVRWLVVAFFVVMVTAAIAQVIFRFVVRYPLGWTEELARIMMIWWVFLSVAVLAWRRRLLRIDALLIALPGRARHALLAFAHLVSALFVGWLFVLSLRLVGLAGTQVSTALQIPYAWIYLALPVGLALAVACFLGHAALDLRSLVTGDRAADEATAPRAERRDV